MSGRSKRQRQRNRGRATRPTTADYANVPYLEMRSRLLAAYDESEEAEWLVQVGRYVQHCWLAEEAARKDADFDEMAHWDEWDKCDEAKLRGLRSDALLALRNYTEAQHRQRWESLGKAIWQRIRPNRWLSWHIGELYRGFLGGLGIVAFGLMIALLWPQVVRIVRSAVDDLLPTATQPQLRTPSEGG